MQEIQKEKKNDEQNQANVAVGLKPQANFFLKLKETRKSKGISVPSLSQLTGIPIRTIEDIEKRGDCMISNAFKCAHALGVSLDDLCR